MSAITTSESMDSWVFVPDDPDWVGVTRGQTADNVTAGVNRSSATSNSYSELGSVLSPRSLRRKSFERIRPEVNTYSELPPPPALPRAATATRVHPSQNNASRIAALEQMVADLETDFEHPVVLSMITPEQRQAYFSRREHQCVLTAMLRELKANARDERNDQSAVTRAIGEAVRPNNKPRSKANQPGSLVRWRHRGQAEDAQNTGSIT